MILDSKADRIIEHNPNMMIPWYLMAAYAYYVEDDPILSDSYFDNLAKRMLEVWDDLKHFHKDLLGPMDLAAGTYLGTALFASWLILCGPRTNSA